MHLSIPKPCNADWSNFTSTTHGGFCEGCKKEVIDFTTWNDEEIKDFFKSSESATCGRFNVNQLKGYTFHNSKIKKQNAWLPLSILGCSLLLPPGRSEAQHTSSVATVVDFASNSTISSTSNKNQSSQLLLRVLFYLQKIVLAWRGPQLY
jgi:hypothetical protein